MTPQSPEQAERRALWFTATILFITLALQRFAVPLSGRTLSIVGPIGLALLAVGVGRGTLNFHRNRLVCYLILTILVLLGALWQAVAPGHLGSRAASTNSLTLFLLLTAFSTVTFATPVREIAFFRLVTLALLTIGVAGILQFVAQFAGLSLFAFTGFIPTSLLNEATYHLKIPVGFGGLLKSNGFFLVEPSVFSQVMALGVAIEAVSLRRPAYLGIFVAGLLLSFSGTGWIVLAAFLLSSTISLGGRGLLIAVGIGVLVGIVLGAAAVLAPDALATLTNRLGEVNQPGTSGHDRFITPFWMLSDVFASAPSALVVGIGSGTSELLTLPYVYGVNTLIKVTAEYGVPATAAYLLLFLLGAKTRIQAAIVPPALILFMFAGGYQEFSPLLFLVLLLTSVARLKPGDDTQVNLIPTPPAVA